MQSAKIKRQCLVCGDYFWYYIGSSELHYYREIEKEFYWVCPEDRTNSLTVDKSRLIAQLKPMKVKHA